MRLLLLNNHRKILINTYQRFYSNTSLKPPWDVLFFGTDNFSLESLKTLHKSLLEKTSQVIRKLEVVTTSNNSYVKKYAEHHQIPIHNWPLHSPEETCKQFQVGVVVSFGNLIPKHIIEAFPLGMINVHASLLPRWRGAAPIIHALAAGDTKTGITIMKIRPHKFDIGEIIHQEEIPIDEQIKMPELHDSLAKIGAKNLLDVLKQSPSILETARIQDSHIATLAPRINSKMADIDFTQQKAKDLYNLNRALTGVYPLVTSYKGKPIKLHNIASYTCSDDAKTIGSVVYDKNTKLISIRALDGWIHVDKLSVPGKKVMSALEFRNGYLKSCHESNFTKK